MKILIIPDVHGRRFWKEPCSNANEYDKIVFLGDYLDPYDFEHISVKDALINFEEIISFAKKHSDKVIMLLGNHDMPYYSNKYLMMSTYHCRHSVIYHNKIHNVFKKNKSLFKLAYSCDDVLFTHAGVNPGWIMKVFGDDYMMPSVKDLSDSLNSLLNNEDNFKYLFMVSQERGGYDMYASCIWADVSETMWYQEMLKNENCKVHPVVTIKQIFGHTLQAFYKNDGSIGYGDIIENGNCKMLDNGNAYVLDTDEFIVKKYDIDM